jgi:hypothetical protein
MSLSDEFRWSLEELTAEQEKAITAFLGQIAEHLGARVLDCSLGTAADPLGPKKLVALKHQHEGALQAQRLFQNELKKIREAARAGRLAASNAAHEGKQK